MISLILLIVGIVIGYFGKDTINSAFSKAKSKAAKVETKAVEEVKKEVADVKQKVKRTYTKKAKDTIEVPAEKK